MRAVGYRGDSALLVVREATRGDRVGIVGACGWLAAVCLTIYPAVAITRMVRRRSSMDYSLPGLLLVVVGLAAYLVTVWESPGWLTGTISLGWNVAMLITVAVFRLRPGYQNAPPSTLRPAARKSIERGKSIPGL